MQSKVDIGISWLALVDLVDLLPAARHALQCRNLAGTAARNIIIQYFNMLLKFEAVFKASKETFSRNMVAPTYSADSMHLLNTVGCGGPSATPSYSSSNFIVAACLTGVARRKRWLHQLRRVSMQQETPGRKLSAAAYLYGQLHSW